MRRHRPDPPHFVRRDGHAQPRAADEQRAIGLALCDEARRGGGPDRIGGRVGWVVGADVDDLRDAGVGFEVALDGVFVGYAGFLSWGMVVLGLDRFSYVLFYPFVGHGLIHVSRFADDEWCCAEGVVSSGRTSQPMTIFHVGDMVARSEWVMCGTMEKGTRVMSLIESRRF